MRRTHARSSRLGIALGIVLAAAHGAQAAELYSLTDLGDLAGGGNFSEALDLNANGVVVGTSLSAAGRRAYRWESGTMTALAAPPLSSGGLTRAEAINASGQIVGYFSSPPSGVRRPILWQPGGDFVVLSDEPGASLFAEALDINDAGQVVGFRASVVGVDVDENGQPSANRAVVWQSGSGLAELGVIERFSVGQAINANGLIAGYGGAPGIDVTMLLSTTTAGATAYGASLETSAGFDVNALGQAVGSTSPASGASSRAVLWDGGQGSDLDALAGATYSEALGINVHGEIVGYSGPESSPHGVLWDETGGAYDLNDRLDASGAGYEIERANAINDAGQIAADAVVGGVSRAVLLTPAPEPAAALQGLVAGVALLASSSAPARRRIARATASR